MVKRPAGPAESRQGVSEAPKAGQIQGSPANAPGSRLGGLGIHPGASRAHKTEMKRLISTDAGLSSRRERQASKCFASWEHAISQRPCSTAAGRSHFQRGATQAGANPSSPLIGRFKNRTPAKIPSRRHWANQTCWAVGRLKTKTIAGIVQPRPGSQPEALTGIVFNGRPPKFLSQPSIIWGVGGNFGRGLGGRSLGEGFPFSILFGKIRHLSQPCEPIQPT